jgi:putative ABC transport system substrate-binding protein
VKSYWFFLFLLLNIPVFGVNIPLVLFDSRNNINVSVMNGIVSELAEAEVIDISATGLSANDLEGYSVIIPIGRQASDLIIEKGLSTPVVFSLVSGPKFLGYQNQPNVTGISMNVGAEEFYPVLAKVLPRGSRIGMIYKSDLGHYLTTEIEFTESKYGYRSIRRRVASRAGMGPALKEMILKHKIKAFWMFPDSLYNEAIFKKLAQVCKKYNVLLITSFESLVEQAGAAFAIAPSYYEMGIQTAEVAERILDGDKPSSIPIQSPRKTGVYINDETIAALDIELPRELLNRKKVTALFQQAQQAMNNRQYSKAQASLADILRLDSKHQGALVMMRRSRAEVAFARGKARLNENKLEQALKYFFEAARYSASARVELRRLRSRLKPRIAGMVRRGIKKYESKKYEDCVQQMRLVLYIEPGHSRARAYLAKARQRLRAIKALR